jgi:hypothetical protein
MYVFVNNAQGERPEFIVAPSGHVAAKIGHEVSPKGNKWYWFNESDRLSEEEGWKLFGNPRPDPEVAEGLEAEAKTEPEGDAS